MPKHGPHKRWGAAEEKLPIPQTLIPRRSQCSCTPGSCKRGARECVDWIKRATTCK